MDISTSILSKNGTGDIIFALSSIVAGIIAYKCGVPPNPKPAHAEKNDVLFEKRIGFFTFTSAIYLSKYVLLGAGILAAILCLDYDNASSVVSSINISRTVCPNYNNLDSDYIKPTPFSTACLTVAIIFGLLRLEAFRQLGKNFTFHLAKPSKLMTTGLYGYMQHPSYTGGLFIMGAIFMLWMQPQSILGCFVPEILGNVQWLSWPSRVIFIGMAMWGMLGRVRQEEGMMKREFGREWEIYHERTARFIPGVF